MSGCSILQILHDHMVWYAAAIAGGYYIFSAFVGTLEMPAADAPKWQRHLFVFLNGLAANLKRAAVALHLE